MGRMCWCCCYLLPLEDREYTKSCPILSVRTLHRLGIKFLIGNFAGMSIMNFITASEIVNQPGLQTNLSRNWWITSISWQICQEMLLRKDESSSEKNFHQKIFFQTSWNPVRKKKVCKVTVVRQNLAIRGYHEFHVGSQRFRDANNGDSYSLINKSNCIVTLYKIRGTLLG